MATFATRTFGGTVVDNSYVAGQKFNGWLQAARAQERLGWTNKVSLDGDRHVSVNVLQDGEPLSGVAATATARHPVGREADVALTFRMAADGSLRSEKPLPRGRWLLHLELRRGADSSRLIESLS
jgi:nitrogen fixation protein FixH